MKVRAAQRTRRFWLTGIAVALLVHALGLLLFQVAEEETVPPKANYSFVSVPPVEEGDGDFLREWAYLFDSSPLFFPTRWNASFLPTVQALKQRPEPLFDPFPARLSYGERDFGLGAIVSARSGSALESFQAFKHPTHAAFGESEVELPQLEDRFALLEFLEPGGDETVLTVTIPLEGAPEEGTRLWSPAAFRVQVVPTGRLGEPMLMRGSGIEEVDDFLTDQLLEVLKSRMLEPGYYRVRAGP